MKKSLSYLIFFIAIQFICSYLVWIVWMLIDGSSLRNILHAFAAGTLAPTPIMLIVASIVYGVVTVALFARMKWCRLSADYLHTRPYNVLTWSAILPLGTIVPLAALQELMPEMPDYASETFVAIMSEPMGYFTIGIFAPFVEEVVFRGAILATLLSTMKGRWLPIIISSLLFALAHGNPAQMPSALLMGLLMGWMYSHTRSIAPCVMVHWANNTAVYIICTLMPSAADMPITRLFGGWNNTLAAIGFSLLIFLPALYQLVLAFKAEKKRS